MALCEKREKLCLYYFQDTQVFLELDTLETDRHATISIL